MTSRRTKACAITKKVKIKVWERDDYKCIFCKTTYSFPEAHVIPRSSGGLGVEENIVTVCRECHNKMDQTTARKEMLEFAKAYLKDHYDDWNEERLVYKKWDMN